METLRLGRIVTEEFLVPAIRKRSRRPAALSSSPGMEYLAKMLIRASSHEILIPTWQTGRPEYLSDTPSLASRIREIDSHQVMRKRVAKYFEPLYEQLSSEWHKKLLVAVVSDFVYKVTLSIKHEAHADIPMTAQMPNFLNELYNSLHGEAQARLAQVQGLWNLYDKQETVPALTFTPNMIGPDMYQRINDLLDESSISYLSQQKYLMGLPGKVKAAILRFKKRIRSIRRDPAYKDKLDISSDSMKFIGKILPQYGDAMSICGELLSKFANPKPKYNPPLVDLDRYRIEISKTMVPYQSPLYEAVIIKRGLTRVLNKTGQWELFEQL